ncbi:MAG: hypothetical protein WKF31_03155 [Thermoleophilaceae bacterium]
MSSSSASPRGTTTTPFWSPVMMSPGLTTIPPAAIACPISPGPRCNGPIGVIPRANTGKSPSASIASMSRMRPSITKPAMPRWRALVEIRSPQTAVSIEVLASTTTTSTGLGDVERLVDHQVVARVALDRARGAEDVQTGVG